LTWSIQGPADLVGRERALVDQPHGAAIESSRSEIVDRARAGMRLESIVNEFETEPFRLRHAGVVVDRNRDHRWIDARKRPLHAAADSDAMRRSHAAACAEQIVQDHPQFDDEESAIGEARAAAEDALNRREDATEITADRNGAGKGVDIVRRVLQKQIALMDRFRDQAELARLQIFEAAMDQPRRGRARAGAPVALVDEQAVDALQREVAEHAGPIDPPADDENLGARIVLQLRERGFATGARSLGAHVESPRARPALWPALQTGRKASMMPA